jgi:hypothetical protein
MRTIEKQALVFVLSCVAVSFAGCGEAQTGDEIGAVSGAVDACALAAPVVTAIREEQVGAVAPGITKIFFVTVANANSAACGPSTIFFVPDAFHLISVVAQPSSAGGVAPGATTTFRLAVTADASTQPATTNIGFTVVANPGASTVGSFVFTTTLDNPLGCNRQAPAVSVDNAQPPPVPQLTPVVYHVTVRNVDNRECGPDTFSLGPDSFHFFDIFASGPFTIAPQASAVFDLTVKQDLPGAVDITVGFDVFGQRHGGLIGTGSVRYRTQ